VEDRIRETKATGLRNLLCHRTDANAAWLEIIMAATDLVAWTKLIGFTDHPDLATREIATFGHRVLPVAARITRTARRIRLRIDAREEGLRVPQRRRHKRLGAWTAARQAAQTEPTTRGAPGRAVSRRRPHDLRTRRAFPGEPLHDLPGRTEG
jgi:hypothetical protein